ncbi:MAG TPA: acyl-CoA carboxylase epsilon subunit [Streptosporangiaceae bacterium]|nr:acyl-CoA carboxylase epsilon subunit [Streptosporangiaceae bacterium]
MTAPSAVTGTDTVAGTDSAADPVAGTGKPVIRVLRGNPDPAELAALVVALALASQRARIAVPAATGDGGRWPPGWLGGHRGYRAPGSWARHGTAVNW